MFVFKSNINAFTSALKNIFFRWKFQIVLQILLVQIQHFHLMLKKFRLLHRCRYFHI